MLLMDRFVSIGLLWNLNVVGGTERQEEEAFAQSRVIHFDYWELNFIMPHLKQEK